jgi:hypothetical protein
MSISPNGGSVNPKRTNQQKTVQDFEQQDPAAPRPRVSVA